MDESQFANFLQCAKKWHISFSKNKSSDAKKLPPRRYGNYSLATPLLKG
jgi:hypothetical protein